MLDTESIQSDISDKTIIPTPTTPEQTIDSTELQQIADTTDTNTADLQTSQNSKQNILTEINNLQERITKDYENTQKLISNLHIKLLANSTDTSNDSKTNTSNANVNSTSSFKCNTSQCNTQCNTTQCSETYKTPCNTVPCNTVPSSIQDFINKICKTTAQSNCSIFKGQQDCQTFQEQETPNIFTFCISTDDSCELFQPNYNSNTTNTTNKTNKTNNTNKTSLLDIIILSFISVFKRVFKLISNLLGSLFEILPIFLIFSQFVMRIIIPMSKPKLHDDIKVKCD